MARILVQTDEGVTVETIEFPIGCTYAMYLMPGCPSNVAVHNMLQRLKCALQDAEVVQSTGERPALRLSEQVMKRLHESEQHGS